MSSAGREQADRLRAMYVASLDAWSRCQVDGCEWHVQLPATRCMDHGGREGPEYMTSAMGGVVYRYSGGDAEGRETE